jgi:hypothetical protein
VSHELFGKMSPIQTAWTLLNINREEYSKSEKDFERIKFICTFINPQMAKIAFRGDTVRTVNIGLREQLEKDLGRKLTEEEILNLSHEEESGDPDLTEVSNIMKEGK